MKMLIPTIVFSILLLCSTPSFAQFSMVSSYPTHGDVNVDTAATISVTFNEPLDTTVRFAYPEGFFMNLYFLIYF